MARHAVKEVTTFETTLSRMAALCSASEHCESEVREKLRKAAMSDMDADRIVERLYDEGYLDTARYCRAYARDKLRFARWGRVKIQQGLRMKGLPEGDIRRALADLDEELGAEYRRILEDTLRQKARSIGLRLADDGDDGNDADDGDETGEFYARRQKLIRFAAGRGFAMNEIMEVML